MFVAWIPITRKSPSISIQSPLKHEPQEHDDLWNSHDILITSPSNPIDGVRTTPVVMGVAQSHPCLGWIFLYKPIQRAWGTPTMETPTTRGCLCPGTAGCIPCGGEGDLQLGGALDQGWKYTEYTLYIYRERDYIYIYIYIPTPHGLHFQRLLPCSTLDALSKSPNLWQHRYVWMMMTAMWRHWIDDWGDLFSAHLSSSLVFQALLSPKTKCDLKLLRKKS